MRKSWLTETQIIGILQDADAGATISEVCRRHSIAAKTLLPLEAALRRSASIRSEESQGTRGREPAAQETRRRREGPEHSTPSFHSSSKVASRLGSPQRIN